VRGIADPAGLPLLVLIFTTVLFLLTPVTKTVTRMVEAQADAFALEKAREPDAAAAVALKLGSYRKLDPGALEEFVFFDHPSGRAASRGRWNGRRHNRQTNETIYSSARRCCGYSVRAQRRGRAAGRDPREREHLHRQ
jgi:STE24 endopeptidase